MLAPQVAAFVAWGVCGHLPEGRWRL